MQYVYMDFPRPNARGTGATLRLELVPAGKANEGRLNVTLAPQDTSSPTGFDWCKGLLKFDLAPVEAAQMLLVLRGYSESIEDGKGIFKRDEKANKVFRFSHTIEPLPGYVISINEAERGGDPRQAQIRLTVADGTALEAAITGGMKEMMFG